MGKTTQSPKELVSNIIATVNGAAEYIPGKWGNVRELSLRLPNSIALPFFTALPPLKSRITVPKISKQEATENTEEIAEHVDSEENMQESEPLVEKEEAPKAKAKPSPQARRKKSVTAAL